MRKWADGTAGQELQRDLLGLIGPALIDFEASCLPEHGRFYPIGAAVKLLHYKPVCDA